MGGVTLRSKECKSTHTPLFFEVYEIEALIPGTSELKISMWDAQHGWGFDKLIGETSIDCEDRWYDDRWRSIGSALLVSNESKVESSFRHPPSVVEMDYFEGNINYGAP